jgi:hypothetical protein
MLTVALIPRIETLWGKAADIDGDGRVAVLFTGTLNEEQVAIGYFNPADFFERNDDAASGAYNPSSNETDIIYAAMPDPDPGSAFSAENVIATIAHEMAHAATFTAKTWGRIMDGNARAAREELFLDEGWSHLAENLCGLGVSGGNIKFLKRFLDDTPAYSFCGPNSHGQEDSAGMRGAITLFLSWLFWKSGGMAWEDSNPAALVDTGGISFLRRMAESPGTGWESIGEAFGMPVRMLFAGMLEEMNGLITANGVYNYATDPLTHEAVDFFINMGVVDMPGGTGKIAIGFPGSSPAGWQIPCSRGHLFS